MKKVGTFGSIPKSIGILKTTGLRAYRPLIDLKVRKGAFMMLYGPFASFIDDECLIQVARALNVRLKYRGFGLK